MELDNRNAVVIGGGSGIGRGIALALAREGMKVAVGDIEAPAAAAVRDEILAGGGAAIAVVVDGNDRESLRALADAAAAAFGDVHLLSNNVGAASPGRLDAVTELDWAYAIEVNLMSMVRSVDVFLPRLRKHGRGAHIVNNAAISALVPITAPSVGSTGQPIGMNITVKHACLGYSETLRFELAPENIGVSILCTGTVLMTNFRNSSARNRPARYGGPFDPGPPPTPKVAVVGPKPPTAEAVGRMVVRGVRANRPHILSHPEWAVRVSARYNALMEDFAFYHSK